MSFRIFSDGGARGNPGPAGIGVVIQRKTEDGRLKTVTEIAEYIGETTNNQAEYQALIAALKKVRELGGVGERVDCFLDSELLVEQLTGRYRVKNAVLKDLVVKVQLLAHELGGEVFFHAVPRHRNQQADQLVNQAIDRMLARNADHGQL